VRRVIGASVGALLTLTLLTGCSVDEIFALGWPLNHVTPQADRMFGEDLPPQTRYNLPIEIVFTVTPVLVVSMLFYFTAVIQNEVNRTGDAELTVSVQASKWNWTFEYPGTLVNGTDQPVSTVGGSDYIPVLVVPTGTRIAFEETSADVIHSFWVPNMLFKRDVIPGLTNIFETSITEEGAVSPEQFAQWLEAKQGGASTPDALRAIGEEPYAVTTQPFPTRREAATN
jgi:cytochrome c oxidase subunit 2